MRLTNMKFMRSTLVMMVFCMAAANAGPMDKLVEKVVDKAGDTATSITNSLTGGVTSGGKISNKVNTKAVTAQVGDKARANTQVGSISGVTAKGDIENTVTVDGDISHIVNQGASSNLQIGTIGRANTPDSNE